MTEPKVPIRVQVLIHRVSQISALGTAYLPGNTRANEQSIVQISRSFNLSTTRVLIPAMAAFSLLVLAFCSATVVSASPRNHIARGQGANDRPGGEWGPPGYSDGGSWGSKTDDWGSASQYGGSWGHSSTVDYPGSQYGGGGGGWGYGTTCAVSTVTEVSTSQVAGPTVYISGSGYTKTLSASTVYISGSDHTSYVPASTVTIEGPVQTSISTSFGTVTQPAAPTTIYITQKGPGWNRTVTHEETDIVTTTTTQREISTFYNEETTTTTSILTLPGKLPRWTFPWIPLTVLPFRYYCYLVRDFYSRYHSDFRIYGTW